MNGLIPKGTLFDTSVATATNAFATDISMSEGRSTVRITVCVDTATKLKPRLSDGSTTIPMILNDDTDLTADCIYTFVFGMDSSLTLNFRHDDAGSVKFYLLLIDEVTGGAI
jgi:hypothetical protein